MDFGAPTAGRRGTLVVALTRHKDAVVNPAFFDLHGIDLGRIRLLANNAKNHFRGALQRRHQVRRTRPRGARSAGPAFPARSA